MAKGLIEIALQLGSKLGANTSKFLGTRSNVSFLGTGPKDGMLFQKSIDPESFATIGIEKVLPDIESSLAYATGGKLNDIELSTLIRNLKTMDETLNPTNVVEMGGGIASLSEKPARGFIKQGDAITSENFGTSQFAPGNNSEFLKNIDTDSLRAKSGLGERQLTEAAGVNAADAAAETTPLMSKLENRIGGMRGDIENRVGTLLDDVGMTPQAIDASIASDKTGIMASVAKGDLPGKTAAAREFLVNTLKVGDDYPTTKLNDVISAEDFKYIMQGGGGAEGDPLVLVQKYFGPRIAEMVPTGGSSEEIAIFTKRVMNNVEDAKGFRPDEPEFDPLTAMFVDNLADGGRAGFRNGGFSILGSNSMTDAVMKRIEALMDEGLDFGSAYKQVTKEVPVLQKKDGGRIGYAKGGLAKILEL